MNAFASVVLLGTGCWFWHIHIYIKANIAKLNETHGRFAVNLPGNSFKSRTLWVDCPASAGRVLDHPVSVDQAIIRGAFAAVGHFGTFAKGLDGKDNAGGVLIPECVAKGSRLTLGGLGVEPCS